MASILTADVYYETGLIGSDGFENWFPKKQPYNPEHGVSFREFWILEGKLIQINNLTFVASWRFKRNTGRFGTACDCGALVTEYRRLPEKTTFLARCLRCGSTWVDFRSREVFERDFKHRV